MSARPAAPVHLDFRRNFVTGILNPKDFPPSRVSVALFVSEAALLYKSGITYFFQVQKMLLLLLLDFTTPFS
jgi:hypothetical protein